MLKWLNLPISAWIRHILSLFERSIWCFEQAGNHELSAKARVHRKTTQFWLDLVSQRFSDDANDQTVIETNGAQIIE
jgi:G:T-mismatch repair DNA endonuclease (very short patch repair protein)